MNGAAPFWTDHLRYAAVSDIGMRRLNNQDATLQLLRDSGHSFHFVVTATTRPIRPGEVDGGARELLEIPMPAVLTVQTSASQPRYPSLSMMLRPVPKQRLSPPWACVGAGLAGGLLGGMFAASGPVMGWFNYRQPLSVAEIRATLLACFALSTTLRSVIVGFGGGLTREVWMLALLALPLVVLGTWAGGRFAPPLSEATLKRCAFGLLLLMGCWTVARALLLGT